MLISIIIPVYNREGLISQTLDSILRQTYNDWECIVVDDISTDNTESVVNEYVEKDNRFKFYKRPSNLIKGANSCRNLGFKKSSGDYVKWFDSDDLMIENHLEECLNLLLKSNADFVVSDSENFQPGVNIEKKPYDFDRRMFEMNSENLALGRIGWITDDFFAKRKIVENISFNELLRNGQEYNFFVRLLLRNKNGIYLNKILTRARLHKGSISYLRKVNHIEDKKIFAEIKILTAYDLKKESKDEYNLIKWFLAGYILQSYELSQEKIIPPYILKAIGIIFQVKGFLRTVSFMMGLFLNYFFKIGYKFFTYARL